MPGISLIATDRREDQQNSPHGRGLPVPTSIRGSARLSPRAFLYAASIILTGKTVQIRYIFHLMYDQKFPSSRNTVSDFCVPPYKSSYISSGPMICPLPFVKKFNSFPTEMLSGETWTLPCFHAFTDAQPPPASIKEAVKQISFWPPKEKILSHLSCSKSWIFLLKKIKIKKRDKIFCTKDDILTLCSHCDHFFLLFFR